MMLAVEEKHAFVVYPEDNTTRIVIEGLNYKNERQYNTLIHKGDVLVAKPGSVENADASCALVEGVENLYLVSGGIIVKTCDKKELFLKAVEQLHRDVLDNAIMNGYVGNDDNGKLLDIISMIVMQAENEAQVMNMRIPYVMEFDYWQTPSDFNYANAPECYEMGEEGCNMVVDGIIRQLDEMGWRFNTYYAYNYFIGKSVKTMLEL